MNFLKETFLSEIGMPLPLIPFDERELIPLSNNPEKRLLFGSKIAAKNPFLIQGNIREFIKKGPKGYFLIGFWGHGINSHAFYYSRVDFWSRIFFRLGYGGAYMDNDLEAKHIKDFLISYFTFENTIKKYTKEFIAIDSMMDGLYRVTLLNGEKHEVRESLLAGPHFEERFADLIKKAKGVRNVASVPQSF